MPSIAPDSQTAPLHAFARLFPDEEESIAFLFRLRWPQGFVCPLCRTCHPGMAARRILVCPYCGHRSSLTTGTLLHGTKKPIREWLLAIRWFSLSPFESSAKELQRLFGLSCYQTAWVWLQKLRTAMAQADRQPCRGVVELGCEPVAPASRRGERALVLTAVEIVPALGSISRMRMRHIAAVEEENLFRFLREAVRETSTLLSGDHQILPLLRGAGAYTVVPCRREPSPRIQGLSRRLETCLHGVHRGGVTCRHLQLYLDEFCFRNNAALLPDHEAVFTALLGGVLGGSIERYRHAVRAAVAAKLPQEGP